MAVIVIIIIINTIINVIVCSYGKFSVLVCMMLELLPVYTEVHDLEGLENHGLQTTFCVR